MEDKDKDISLLPEEMRRAEEKERQRKEKAVTEIKLHVPEGGKNGAGWTQPLETKTKFSFWDKLFGTAEERRKKAEAKKRILEEREKKEKIENQKKEEARQQKEREKQGVRREEPTGVNIAERLREEAVRRAEEEAKIRERIERNKREEEKRKELKKATVIKPKPRPVEHEAEPPIPGMKVSLIPEDIANPPEERFRHGFLTFVLVIAFSILVIAAGFLWMVWQESKVTNETANLGGKIAALDQEIKKYDGIKAESQELQKEIKLVKDLLDKHVYWTKFFDLLEQNTVVGVYYLSLAADIEGGVVLSATADSYSSIAAQLVAFREAVDFVKEAIVSSAVAQEGEEGQISGVNFNIDLKLVDGVFKK
ncbi:MAG: hypothetical protein PHD51_00415 [Patescibacteria group bacterium]|nr:hypothetical protein [Patescibacteria group bacterium]MDD5490669.1 hypothetical protein [Patescibacteria group bacterium]